MVDSPSLQVVSVSHNGEVAAKHADRVEALLAAMTLPEKVGQMTQLTLEAVSAQRGWRGTPHKLDGGKLREAVVERHVGSLLNVWDMALAPETWRAYLAEIQQVATRETRLGIPVLYGIDAVHGHNYATTGTLFPQNLAFAATWNPELLRTAAALTAREVRACGIPWNFAPCLDLGRQPLWSRYFETFGEDVHLATVLADASVRGMQGEDPGAADRVAACAKHFLGYGFPLSGHDRTPAWIPEHYLREYFLPPFAAAIRAGVRSIMVNSGEVNGRPVHASHYLLTQVLRGELGFEGVVVTDWEDVRRLHTMHRVAPDERTAVRMAVEAGIDMSMVPLGFSFSDHLLALVEAGEVPAARIDASVRRILQLKADLGLFDDPTSQASHAFAVGSAAAQQVSRTAAEQALVLTENRADTLPLPPAARLLVTGPTADSRAALCGPWSYTWQGQDEGAYPRTIATVQAALGEVFPSVTYLPGATFDEVVEVEAVVAAAAEADAIVCCLGEAPAVEKPGDINDLRLSPAQCALFDALAEAGKPLVLVLLTDRPRICTDLAERADGVVFAGRPGPEGSHALADLLAGRLVPSGKLPFTYPRHVAHLTTYDHKQSDRTGLHFGVDLGQEMDGVNPLWPFGHGLSYTAFAYQDLVVSPAVVGPEDVVTIEVSVVNTGAREGREVVPVYVQDLFASLTPPVKRLRAFEAVTLAPQERQRVRFEVPVRTLAFVHTDQQWTLETGDFEVQVGGLRTRFHLALPSA